MLWNSIIDLFYLQANHFAFQWYLDTGNNFLYISSQPYE